MKDRFDEMIDRFLVPIEKLSTPLVDAAYFFNKDMSFVYANGYMNPPDGLWAQIIYYPSPDGYMDIFGRRYNCTVKKMTENGLMLTSPEHKLAMQFKVDPSLDPERVKPPYADYLVEFPRDSFLGWFPGKRSLKICMETYPKVDDAVRGVSELLQVPVDRLGATGSLSYGLFEENEEDIDLIFFGTVEENKETINRIYELTKIPSRQVKEYGKFWPMRFLHDGILICPFFVYSEWDEVPFKDLKIRVLREEVEARGIVTDDYHGMYMPSILQLGEVYMDGEELEELELILYEGSLRGEYRYQNRLHLKGRLVEIVKKGGSHRALLVTHRAGVELIS